MIPSLTAADMKVINEEADRQRTYRLMNDTDVKAQLQTIAKSVERQVPGRAFFILIWPSAADEEAHYVANCPREMALAGMVEFIGRNPKGPPLLPSIEPRN